MINYNAMPEMTEQEIKRLGNETIAYYDHKVNDYVVTTGSIEYFAELIGQGDNIQLIKDIVYPVGTATVHTENNGIVTIKLLGSY